MLMSTWLHFGIKSEAFEKYLKRKKKVNPFCLFIHLKKCALSYLLHVAIFARVSCPLQANCRQLLVHLHI